MADKLIRNLDHRSVLHMADLVDYKPGKTLTRAKVFPPTPPPAMPWRRCWKARSRSPSTA